MKAKVTRMRRVEAGTHIKSKSVKISTLGQLYRQMATGKNYRLFSICRQEQEHSFFFQSNDMGYRSQRLHLDDDKTKSEEKMPFAHFGRCIQHQAIEIVLIIGDKLPTKRYSSYSGGDRIMLMEEAPVYPQAVIGYRIWSVRPVAPSLQQLLAAEEELAPIAQTTEPIPRLYPVNSVIQLHAEFRSQSDDSGAWRPGLNQAICVADPTHTAPPVKKCGCGLYAYHQPHTDAPDRICGAILAKGRIQVHHDGFRAQSAQVIGLLRDNIFLSPYWLQRVADHYQVPLFDNLDALQEHALSLGTPVPIELRPPKPSLYHQ